MMHPTRSGPHLRLRTRSTDQLSSQRVANFELGYSHLIGVLVWCNWPEWRIGHPGGMSLLGPGRQITHAVCGSAAGYLKHAHAKVMATGPWCAPQGYITSQRGRAHLSRRSAKRDASDSKWATSEAED